LQVRTKKRKKLTRPRIPLSVPDRINERWSVDFVSDQLANGRRFRVFNLVDDFSRECLLQVVDFSISGQRLTREQDRLAEKRGLPARILLDNGPELTSKAMFFWSKRTSVKLHFIQPGKPTQNAFVESFNGKFRDYCLDLHWFASLADAKDEIENWRVHYNHVRPHRSLGKMPPAVFARQAALYAQHPTFRLAQGKGCGQCFPVFLDTSSLFYGLYPVPWTLLAYSISIGGSL
jgi:putative transposase